MKPYYNRLLAGLNITEEDIDKGSRRIPDHAPAVLRAYSDSDALKHAEDGNLDVDSSYFDSEDTHEYFINRFKRILKNIEYKNFIFIKIAVFEKYTI